MNLLCVCILYLTFNLNKSNIIFKLNKLWKYQNK